MPSQHNQNFAASAALALLEFHGEPIFFVPRTGMARGITAIVERRGPDRAGEIPRATMPRLTVKVLGDPDNADFGGIDRSTLNLGGDRLELEYQPGAGIEKFYLTQLPARDNGGLLVFEIF